VSTHKNARHVLQDTRQDAFVCGIHIGLKGGVRELLGELSFRTHCHDATVMSYDHASVFDDLKLLT